MSRNLYLNGDYATAKARGYDMVQLKADGWWCKATHSDGGVDFQSETLRSFGTAALGGLDGCTLIGEFMRGTQWSQHPDRKGRFILRCKGWGMDQAGREKLVASTLAGELRCVWLTPAEALHSLWASKARHKDFSKPWIALFKEEIGAAKASVDRTAIHAVALEGRELKRRSNPPP